MSKSKEGKISAYKLRDNRSGLFLAQNGRWTRIGKTWPRKSDAIRAINSVIKRAPESNLGLLKKIKTKDDIIDELGSFEVVELTESSSYPILFHVDKIGR